MANSFNNVIRPNFSGNWAKAYWSGGSSAAEAYCAELVQKRTELSGFFLRASKTPEVRGLPELKHKVKDLAYDYQRSCTKYASTERGRGVPGRTPFNSPSFDKRYTSFDHLNSHLIGKIAYHSEHLETILELLPLLSVDFEEFEALLGEAERHEAAIQKWKAREVWSAVRPELFLLPRAQDPLTLMGFRQAHTLGWKGSDVGAVILEPEEIGPHADLEKHLVPFPSQDGIKAPSSASASVSSSSKLQEHGTHVTGILHAAAPEATIDYRKVGHTDFSAPHEAIINASMTLEHPLVKETNPSSENLKEYAEEISETHPELKARLLSLDTISDEATRKKELSEIFNELHIYVSRKTFGILDDSLFIQAQGNDGASRSENPHLVLRDSWLMDNPNTEKHYLSVVNLQENGLYPHPSSTLPGDTFAELSLSAVGTNVLSTLPGDQYGKKTGSSMAAPFVTAAAVLLHAAFPTLTYAEIRYALLEGANPIILSEEGIPELITDPRKLASIPKERILVSRRIYGRGLLNVLGAFSVAHKLATEKHSPLPPAHTPDVLPRSL